MFKYFIFSAFYLYVNFTFQLNNFLMSMAFRGSRSIRQLNPQEVVKSLLMESKRHKNKINDSFWAKIRQIAAKEPETLHPDQLLIDLFDAAAKHSQTIFIGNHLLQNNVRLPEKQEALFILALARKNPSQAIRLWQSREVSSEYTDFWKNTGIQLHCLLGRLNTAEILAKTTELSTKSIYYLVQAYSVSGGPKLEAWTQLLAEKGSKSELNRAAGVLLRRHQIKALTLLLPKLDNNLGRKTVTSILGSTNDRVAAATALSTRPDIVSDVRFVKSWMRSLDPELVPQIAPFFQNSVGAKAELINSLLKTNKLDSALEIFEDMIKCGPPPTMAIIHRFISYGIHQKDTQLVDEMISHLQKRTTRSNDYSRTMQLIVSYLSFKRQYSSLLALLKTTDMSKLQHSNFVAIWKALYACAKSKPALLQADFDMQQFFVDMVQSTNFRVDKRVFQLATRAFLRAKDVRSAAFTVRYMFEIGNLPIDDEFIASLQELSNRASLDHDWKGLVQQMCIQHGARFESICLDTHFISPGVFSS